MWRSLRARSIAGRRAGIVVAGRSSSLRWRAGLWIRFWRALDRRLGCCIRSGFAASPLTWDARRRTLLAQRDAQPLDSTRIGIQHFDFEEARSGDQFAAHRQPPHVIDE